MLSPELSWWQRWRDGEAALGRGSPRTRSLLSRAPSLDRRAQRGPGLKMKMV